MALLERLMPKVGDVIRDRYELREVLGEGGFGVVFRARQRGLDSDVAVKVLMPHLLAHDALVKRFEREVTVVKTLRHPNTIRVLDVGQTEDEIPFYVMELVTGRPLERELEGGPLSPSRTRRISLQVLKSLAEAHEHGIVHRDLKPANVMLCEVFGERDFVKVLDFGIAKAIETEHGGLVTQTGAILGTPTYLSPEQARGDRDLDPRSDLYAVGLIVAECLSGQPVVSGSTTYQIVAEHAHASPLALPGAVRESPFYGIVARAIQKDRELRYASAFEMAEAIAALTDLSDDAMFEVQTGSHSGPFTPSPSARALGRAPTTPDLSRQDGLPAPRSRGLTAVLGLLAVGVGVALALAMGDNGEPAGSKDEGVLPMRERSTGVEGLEAVEPAGDLAGTEVEGSDGSVALVPPQAVPEAPPPEPPAVDPARVHEAIVRANQGVGTSLPARRLVRFEGTEGTRVLLGEIEIGLLPLSLELPRLDASLELRFERRGYETRTESVGLDEDVVRVELQRRRRASEPDNGTSPEEPPARLPFEEAPIYD